MTGVTKAVLTFHRSEAKMLARGREREASLLAALCRAVTGVELDPHAVVGSNLTIKHGQSIVIGPGARIGDDCVIHHEVTMGVKGGPGPDEYPTLGNRVVVYAGAKIIGGIHVGDDAVIGANSVVMHDVAPGAIVVGNPARALSR